MKIFHTREIKFQDGVLHLRFPEREAGREVGPGLPAMGPGWRLISVLSLGGFLYCLRLSTGAQRAYWYLDDNLNLIFNKTENLLLSFRFPGSGKALLDTVFEDIESAGPINEIMIDVVDLLREFSTAAAAMPGAAPQILTDPRASPIAAKAHETICELNRQDPNTPPELGEVVSDVSFRRGFVEGKHPNGGSLRIDYFLPYVNFWYIGFSADSSDPFCTLVTDHNKITEALFDTSANILYARSDVCRDSASARLFLAEVIGIRLIRQYLYQALRKRRAEGSHAGLMLRENHIGHYIWNELSCVDAIVRCGKTPAIFSYPASDEPVYPVDEIFPEARGKMYRGVWSLAEIAAAACQDVAFFPFMAYRVTQSLANRVLALAFDYERDFAEELTKRKEDTTILLVGLRLENRCWTRQDEGYVRLIRRLSQFRDRRFLVLFDGHNYAPNSSKAFVRSYSERGTQNDSVPVVVREEIDLVNSVIRQTEVERSHNIEIRNLIPCSVGASIIAAKLADYFVTHWGAGLAKYKWIANARGGVISSANVLKAKADLRIYDTETFRDSPIALDYFPAEFVQDLGNENALIKSPHQERRDFDIDPARFAEFVVSKLLEPTTPQT